MSWGCVIGNDREHFTFGVESVSRNLVEDLRGHDGDLFFHPVFPALGDVRLQEPQRGIAKLRTARPCDDYRGPPVLDEEQHGKKPYAHYEIDRDVKLAAARFVGEPVMPVNLRHHRFVTRPSMCLRRVLSKPRERSLRLKRAGREASAMAPESRRAVSPGPVRSLGALTAASSSSSAAIIFLLGRLFQARM